MTMNLGAFYLFQKVSVFVLAMLAALQLEIIGSTLLLHQLWNQVLQSRRCRFNCVFLENQLTVEVIKADYVAI